MTSLREDRGGSFRALRDCHLPMFDSKLHRHDRGWPHPPPKSEAEQSDKVAKQVWKTVGIFHFRHDEEDHC
jgi:hypothetical protein